MKRNYYNKSMCALCGGKCCQNMAGSYAPEDFKQELTSDFIVSLLLTGKFAIDWYEGDARYKKTDWNNDNHLSATYYLRPRHVKEDAVKGSWGGVCVNWKQETGCSLEKSDRPMGCRKLVPKFDRKTDDTSCFYKKEDKAGKQEIAARWIPFQNIIQEAKTKYFQFQEDGRLIAAE